MRPKRSPALPINLALEQLVPLTSAVWAGAASFESKTAPTRLLFTAAERGAGTSVLAAATALGLARYLRAPVSLVEMHLRAPGMARYLGIDSTPGLSDCLIGACELDECWQTVPAHPGLRAVTAGTPRPAVPGELATSAGRALLAELDVGARFVVIDAPPVTEGGEGRALLGHADAVVLVVRARHTRRGAAESAAKLIRKSGARLVGTILNGFRSDLPFAA